MNRKRLPTCLCLLALVLAPLLLFGRSVFGRDSYVPFDIAQWPPWATLLEPGQVEALRRGQNTDPTEPPIVFLPEIEFARQELQHGRLPEWNPYARVGAPLLATSVVGLCYPCNWLLLLFADPVHGLALGAWLALASAGLCMF